MSAPSGCPSVLAGGSFSTDRRHMAWPSEDLGTCRQHRAKPADETALASPASDQLSDECSHPVTHAKVREQLRAWPTESEKGKLPL